MAPGGRFNPTVVRLKAVIVWGRSVSRMSCFNPTVVRLKEAPGLFILPARRKLFQSHCGAIKSLVGTTLIAIAHARFNPTVVRLKGV